MERNKDNLFIILLALLLHTPALLASESASHSSTYNFIWTTQFADAFLSGNFYPRWFPDSFEGLGSPTFYFYPPLAFWVSGSFAALGLSATVATVCAGIVFSAASGLAMYSWLRQQTPHALVGAIAYMAAPYHLYNFYVRGALAEYASFMWPPLILLAMSNLRGARSIFALGLVYAGLLITHLPVALLVTVFLIIPFGIRSFLTNQRVLLPGVAAGLLGIGVASFYLVPALQLQDAISNQLLWSDYYKPETWFPWNQPYLNYLLGIPALALALLVFGVGARSYWGAVTAILAAASIGLIPFVWEIDLLAKVQFSWRLLGAVEFAVVTAIVLGPRSTPWMKLGSAIAIFPIAMFTVATIATLRAPMDIAQIESKRPDAPEYLPRGLDVAGITGTQRLPNLEAFSPLSRSATVHVTRPGRVVMGRADFPIWRVMHEGKEIPHSGPLINFNAPEPGIYSIERRLLTSELFGFLISILTVVMMVLLIAVPQMSAQSRKRKLLDTQLDSPRH